MCCERVVCGRSRARFTARAPGLGNIPLEVLVWPTPQQEAALIYRIDHGSNSPQPQIKTRKLSLNPRPLANRQAIASLAPAIIGIDQDAIDLTAG